MEITPVAYFHSPLTSKFGIPRQSGLSPTLAGTIVFTPEYRHPDAIRGLDGFDYLWLIWEFSANNEQSAKDRLTVRPPRLGGNERIGVFASRSPFRPNNLGLSCVRIDSIEMTDSQGPVIHVLGADLMDGTPIYDIKPYLLTTDCHPEATKGFTQEHENYQLEVDIPEAIAKRLKPEKLEKLREVLAQDPRPAYHHDEDRVYGFPFDGYEVRFSVKNGTANVHTIHKL